MFWDLEPKGSAGWLYDGAAGRKVSRGELGDSVVDHEERLRFGTKVLVALLTDNTAGCVACYLAALRSGNAVLLLDAAGDATLRDAILRRYRPEVVLHPEFLPVPQGYLPHAAQNGYACAVISEGDSAEIHQDTALLLTTSGSTGSPKLVRLSYGNLQSNAEAIASYLQLTPGETAITSLPLSYSYGLSVLNSHLLAWGNIVCTDASLLSRDFWQLFRDCGCTSFAGVPYSYLMLERLRLERMELPSLRTLTQAGGRLAKEKVELFAGLARHKGYRFLPMYGQTEATARIAYLPWERLPEKAGSVGIAIPGGEISIAAEGGEPGRLQTGEVIYRGPNVMMGYGEQRGDLARGDELSGVLCTGDLGYRDADGFLFITGRNKRFVKVFGLRLNLDDVERLVEQTFSVPAACIGSDDLLVLILESSRHELVQQCCQQVAALYRIHHSALRVELTSAIPVTVAGKKDYPTMERELKLHERA